MRSKYMVCAEATKAMKGIFGDRKDAMTFARKQTYNGCPMKRDRLSEVLLVFEVHEDGNDILLARL